MKDPMIQFLRENLPAAIADPSRLDLIIQSAEDRFCSDKETVEAQAARIRDLVSENAGLRKDLEGMNRRANQLVADIAKVVSERDALKEQAVTIAKERAAFDAKARKLEMELETVKSALVELETLRQPIQQLPRCFLAQAFGFWAVDIAPDLAVLKLKKLGASKSSRVFIDLFLGDDAPQVTNQGMNITHKAGALKIRVGEFETMAAFLRNYVKP